MENTKEQLKKTLETLYHMGQCFASYNMEKEALAAISAHQELAKIFNMVYEPEVQKC